MPEHLSERNVGGWLIHPTKTDEPLFVVIFDDGMR